MLNTKYILIGFFSLIVFTLLSLAFISEGKKQSSDLIVFTAISSTNELTNNKFPEGSKLFSFDSQGQQLKELTEEFYSARSPEVSFDGFKLLFSAQKTSEDKWQIWELELRNNKIHQITDRSYNCTDPAYLPDGRVVFSSKTDKMSGIDGVMALFTINNDGSGERQITFHPNNDQSPSVLRDGRILTNTNQVYPDQGAALQLALRPDGAKAELFYKPASGSSLTSRGWENNTGQFVYVEKSMGGKTRVISVNYNRPKDSEKNLSLAHTGQFNSIFPTPDQRYLVSYQENLNQNYAIYDLSTEDQSELEAIYSNLDYHLIEPVNVIERLRPKNLPSRIEEGEDNGMILCLDADLSQDSIFSSLNSSKSFTVEVQGVNNTFGMVPVSADGSFYIEVPSNEPIRFQTFNNEGQLIRGPSDWIWVRPLERRGCIGCHEDKELAPVNHVPLAVKKKPINLTTNIKKSNSE